MKALCPILTSLLCGLTALSARAEIALPNGEPTKILETENGNQLALMIVIDGAELLEAPNAKSRAIKTLNYGQTFYAGDSVMEGDQGFFLACEISEENLIPHGWVSAENCLTDRYALRTENNLYQKALIVNKWQETEAGELKIQVAEALNGPGERPGEERRPFEPLKELGLYRFYYVYRVLEKQGKGKYYLLGLSHAIKRPKNWSDFIVGWVPASRVSQWNTRQAIEFNKDTLEERLRSAPEEVAAKGGGGVVIFETKEELEAHLAGLTEFNNRPLVPVASEDTTRKTRWSYEVQRFPLFAKEKNDRYPEWGPYYQLGYIGDQIYVEEGTRGLSAEELASQAEALRSEKDNLGEINVVFVIDSTGSMDKWFEATADAVRAISSELSSGYSDDEERPRVRFSVTYYRDYPDKEKSDSYLVKRLPLTEKAEDVEDFLREDAQGGGDDPEAVFYGIDYAVGEAVDEIENDLAFKVVVLIGDCGNHRVDEDGFTVEKIIERLEAADFDFAAIHMVPGGEHSDSAAISDFASQTKRISDLTRGNYKAIGFISGDQASEAQAAREIASSIVERAERTINDASLAKLAIEDVLTGVGLLEINNRYGVRIAEKVTQAMVKRDVDPRSFLAQSASIFGAGWATANNGEGVPQVDMVYLVDRPTIQILVGILAGFVQEVATKENVQDMWGRTLRAHIGEFEVERPIGELIEAYVGLPVQTGVLKQSLSEIANLSDEDLARIQEELRMRMQLMEAFLDDREVEIVKEATEEGVEMMKVKDLGDRRVWFEGSDRQYAWITSAELP